MAERTGRTSARSTSGSGTRKPVSDSPPTVQRRRRSTSASASGNGRGGSGGSGSGKRSSGKGSSATKGSSTNSSGKGSTARTAAPSADGAGASPRAAGTADAPRRGLARLAIRPSSTGPKVRLGVLWFFLALAAVTAGRWPTAILWGLVAVLAGRELLILWWTGAPDGRVSGSDRVSPPPGVVAVVAGLILVVPAAAAVGTGLSGAALLLVVVALAAFSVMGRAGAAGLTTAQAGAIAIAVLVPAVPAAAVVLVVGAHLWAGLFLVLAVSLYDAGCFIGGAESSSLVEGPVTGIIGVLAVTFTMAMFQAPPFDTTSAAIVGGLCAVACPVGQWAASAVLPSADSPARALRRLDTYIVAAPVFLGAAWVLA